MTTQQPPRCHYDHTLGERVIDGHRDDCEQPDEHRSCLPCTAKHCRICGREHLTNDHPQTCATCVGKTRDDLVDIRHSCTQLRSEAAYAGADGRLAAAAPIPGALAMVLISPAVTPDQLSVGRTYQEDRASDPIPPLAVLAWWEDTWRTWYDHTPAACASISSAVGYLDGQLTHLAQTDPAAGGPDFGEFARSIVHLRVSLEHALHNEREPERGVECFECGARLVRRHHDRSVCRHRTDARRRFETAIGYVDLGYPEIGPTRVETRAARIPCGRCSQGGLDDPSAGQSWECPSCRKDYDPGEYASAVRRSLLEGGPDGDGWTHISMAAEAATMMTMVSFTPTRIRRWMDRGQVASMCQWSPGVTGGLRLVLWQDVKERAADAVVKAHMAELERRREAEQEQALRSEVDTGRDPVEAGEHLGIHPARVEKFIARWAAQDRQEARWRTA